MILSLLFVALSFSASAKAADDKLSLRYLHVIIGNKFYVPDYNASDGNFRFPGELSYQYFLENGHELPKSVMSELYSLGKELRENLLYDRLLGDYYSPDLMKLQTTAYPASQIAGQLVSAGLWPPVGEQDWSNGTLNWQPITFDYDHPEEDFTLLGTLCPNFERDTKIVTSAYNSTAHARILKKFDCLKNETQINVSNPFHVSLLRLALENSYQLNQTLPSWAELEETSETLKNFSMVAYDLLSKTLLQQKLNGGGLLKTIVQDMQKFDSNLANTRKISIFSGDDRNLMGVLKNLNYSASEPLNAGAALIFETHQNQSGKFVKIRYRHGPNEILDIKLMGCNNTMFCPLEAFSNIVKNVFPENETLLCGERLTDELLIPDDSAAHLSTFPVLLVLIFGLLANKIV